MIKMTLLKLCSIAIKQFVYKNKSAAQQVRSPSMQTSGNREELSLGFLFDFNIYTMQTNLSLERSEHNFFCAIPLQSFASRSRHVLPILHVFWILIENKLLINTICSASCFVFTDQLHPTMLVVFHVPCLQHRSHYFWNSDTIDHKYHAMKHDSAVVFFKWKQRIICLRVHI